MRYWWVNHKQTHIAKNTYFRLLRGQWIKLAFLITILSTVGCTNNSSNTLPISPSIASSNLLPLSVNTSLPVKTLGRLVDPTQSVHIYIEGDGRAWRNNNQPSTDPTPSNPVGMKLAELDQSVNVLYIARPCQFNADPKRGCHFRVWTEERFAQSETIEPAIKQLVGYDQPIVLIGFSGGANIAVQLATQLKNVEGIITVAGNLDSASFARFHRTPLELYGNNQSILTQLRELPQLHISGSKDQIIPPTLTQQMMSNSLNRNCHGFQTLNADHHGPWQIDWTQFETLRVRCDSP